MLIGWVQALEVDLLRELVLDLELVLRHHLLLLKVVLQFDVGIRDVCKFNHS